MLTRLDFFDLEDNMKDIKMYELNDFLILADNFITYINSINNNSEIMLRIKMIRKAEETAREMVQIIISKINPDLNWLIKLDNDASDSYKKLTECIGVLLDKIEKQKETLSNNLSNKDFIESNKITNKVTIDFFSSFLHSMVNDLVYLPLKEASTKFFFLDATEKPIIDDGEKIIFVLDEQGNRIRGVKKDKNLFWFFVYSYLFRSSQVIGFFSLQKTPQRFPDFKDLRKLIRMEISRKPVSEGEEEKTEKTNEVPKEDKKQDENLYHKEVKSPEVITFLPKINGSNAEEEQESSDEEDFDIEDEESEEESEDGGDE